MSNKSRSVISVVIAVLLVAVLVVSAFGKPDFLGEETSTEELSSAVDVTAEDSSEDASETASEAESESATAAPTDPTEAPVVIPTEDDTAPAEASSEDENKAILGDVDMNGKVTAKDARIALRASAKLETITAEQIKRADVDADGEIFAKDARAILRYSAKLVTASEFEAKAYAAHGYTAAPLTLEEVTTA